MSELSLLPVEGMPSNAIVDVIFVHGLGGDGRATWTANNEAKAFWPEWISQDFASTSVPYAVWLLEYPACATAWVNGGDAMALPDRASGVLRYLARKEIGKRPIIFIAHSLGGLLVKYLLHSSSEDSEDSLQAIADRTLAVVFLATPHHGARLATLLTLIPFGRATAAAKDLVADNAYLKELNDWYRADAEKHHINTLSFCENRRVRLGLSAPLVVNSTTGDPNIPGKKTIPIDADHIEICKPADRDAPVYVETKNFLQQAALLASTKMRESPQDLRRFLGGVGKEDTCQCILSAFRNARTSYRTTDGLSHKFCGATLSPEDTAAAVYLCSLSSRVRSFGDLTVMNTTQFSPNEVPESNLLLVGSSLTNTQTNCVLGWENAHYRFVTDAKKRFGIECTVCKEHGQSVTWLPNDGDENLDRNYQPGKATKIDYAIVQRLKWKKFDIFVLAGLGPVGTKGAAYFMMQEWPTLYAAYADRQFGVVLRFGSREQPATFNRPVVVHRTDPQHAETCVDRTF